MGLLAVLGPTSCPKTAARTAALTNVMASGNSLCLSMITRKLNTISLFPLKLPRFLPSNDSLENDSTSVNSGALRARRFALLHSRCNAITKNSVGLDALTLSRKRGVSPAARGLLPFAASNDNETAVHRRYKASLARSLFLSLSRLIAVSLSRRYIPRNSTACCFVRLPLSSPLHYSPSTSFHVVTGQRNSPPSSFTSRARPGTLKP